MPYSVTPVGGFRLAEVDLAADPTNKSTRTRLGTVVTADDGHDYIYAKASGAIANAATAVLTEPAMTMASGAGAWTNTTGVALAVNDQAWFKKTAI